ALPGILMLREKELWLSPYGFGAMQNKIKYARLGIQLGIIHKNCVRLTLEFETLIGNECKRNNYPITIDQAYYNINAKD
ncbi:16S rRNA (cytosine(1407)-C(5))-methyltransferase RsmF, partial [Pseudoalteromonas sp. S3785]